MERKILHIDLDAFFCAVEAQKNPALRHVPFAVGGQPEQRGVVASCSYPARYFGVRSAMPMSQAVRLCPGLRIVSADHHAYRRVSRRVMARLRQLTPLVEQLSIDEAFLDVSDLPDAAETLARRLQATINRELQLPCSLGVATNKLVAKIANNVGKASSLSAIRSAIDARPPNAVQVVPPGDEATFLAPLACTELWGVGPKTAAALAGLGMHTIGDIAHWPAADLERRFGKHGASLAQRARGIDHRLVETEREAKSISQETTFVHDISTREPLRQTLHEQAQGVSRSLQKKSLVASTVKLKIRWADFTTPTRQLTLEQPTDDAEGIYAAALLLFDRIWQAGQPVRLLGVGVSGLSHPIHQLSLWDVIDAEHSAPDEDPSPAEAARRERLAAALTTLRNRFGDDAVQRGSDLYTEDLLDDLWE